MSRIRRVPGPTDRLTVIQQAIAMNSFDSYMLNKVRRLKDVRARYAAAGEKAVLADVPEEYREFVTGIWPPEFERILNGESASMLAQDAQAGKLESCLDSATLSPHSTGQVNHFDICSPEINGIIPS